MKRLLTILFLAFLLTPFYSQAQGECLPSYTSDHVVVNNTSDALFIETDNLNQASFPTTGPDLHIIPPGQEVKISDLEWAQEFRDPATWYSIKVLKTKTEYDLTDPTAWVFERIAENQGVFRFSAGIR